MYKTIVLPVDLNSTFKKPMKLALSTAIKFRSKIIVLNVLEEYPDEDQSIMSRVSLESVNEDIKRIAALNKDLIIKRLSEFEKDNFDYEIAIKTGDAADNILDLSSSESADLIVMGSNGKDDISDFFMGTTSSKVLEKSTIPVLVVPNTD